MSGSFFAKTRQPVALIAAIIGVLGLGGWGVWALSVNFTSTNISGGNVSITGGTYIAGAGGPGGNGGDLNIRAGNAK